MQIDVTTTAQFVPINQFCNGLLPQQVNLQNRGDYPVHFTAHGTATTTDCIKIPAGRSHGIWLTQSIEGLSVISNGGTSSTIITALGEEVAPSTSPGLNITGLVSYYKMEGTPEDSKGANEGTENLVTYGVGKIGQASIFNDSSAYINIGNGLNGIMTSSAYSINTWIYPTSYADGQPFGKYIISNDESSGVRQFAIGLGSSGSAGPGKFFFESMYSGHVYGTQGSEVTLNEWTMLTVTYDGTNVKSFINGALNTTTAVTTLPSSSNGISIGMRNYVGYLGNFIGSIDEMSIFDKTLSEAEITSLYNGGSGEEINI